jgi:hypothetical protein
VIDETHPALKGHLDGPAGVGGRLGDGEDDAARFDPAAQVASGEAGEVGVHVEFDGARLAGGELDAGEADQPANGPGDAGDRVGEVELRDRGA